MGLLAAGTLAGAAVKAGEGPRWHSSHRIQRDGHGNGRDLAILTWKTRGGEEAGEVQVPITGDGRIGPVSIKLPALGGVPNDNEWDTREWQWWKGYPFDPGQKRPREVAPAVGGVDTGPGGVRVWTRFVCDDVETTQEWFFADLDRADRAVYDCLITVRNGGSKVLEEYGQFFASYTAWNKEKGHHYWATDGALVNYSDRGGRHLDYYVTAKGSAFDRLGYVPHCPRGGGKVKATWRHPVSVSQPGPRGHRHIVMTEEARTAAITQGMSGVAQDYIIYRPGGVLRPGGSFQVHVRHLIAEASPDQLPKALETWWSAFSKDHDRIRRLTKVR
jgi:hypothetical protein